MSKSKNKKLDLKPLQTPVTAQTTVTPSEVPQARYKASGNHLTLVKDSPARGEFSFSNHVYRFAHEDTNAVIVISAVCDGKLTTLRKEPGLTTITYKPYTNRIQRAE